jgi:hypothetical protein
MTPIDWSAGVDGDFAKMVRPVSSLATRSV